MSNIIDGFETSEPNGKGEYKRRQNHRCFVYVEKMPIKRLTSLLKDGSEKPRQLANINDKNDHYDGFCGSVEYFHQLEKSIKKDGILNPLEVEMQKDGMLLVVCGCSRLYISKKIHLETVPCIIFVHKDQKNIPEGIMKKNFEELREFFYIDPITKKSYFDEYYTKKKDFDWWIDEEEKNKIMKG